MDLLPKNQPLSNLHILDFARKYLKCFRGVFMRDTLPLKCKERECGIINLDSELNSGTHWCAYHKKHENCFYFDSFGNLPPPKELVDYLGSNCRIYYNFKRYQEFNTVICGHLCLRFLYEIQQNSI